MRFTPTRVGTFHSPRESVSYNAVHPHTRGDIPLAARERVIQRGSPPHAWGHYRPRPENHSTPRFTPTRVGTLWPSSSATATQSVHPHTRGDIDRELTPRAILTGSPPHAWGHSLTVTHAVLSQRFTPTRVGTLLDTLRARLYKSVHPHTRGDIVLTAGISLPPYGSPPHAWGHSDSTCDPPTSSRFTPTRVGTLSKSLSATPPSTVHPHTRGDIASFIKSAGHDIGSPPHAWGHFMVKALIHWIFRFTPTRVGTFCPSSAASSISAVHPHTRGDISRRVADEYETRGSPPHAWGHLFSPAPRRRVLRFTPTRVGTFELYCRATHSIPVHPHTRADIAVRRNRKIRLFGSPPHAWGHSRGVPRLGRRSRFTPTRVGTFAGGWPG